MSERKIIPIFYTCDDENASSTVNSLKSIIDKKNGSYSYTVCILHNGLNKKNIKRMFELGKGGVNITLEDVSAYTRDDDAKISFSSDFVRAFIPEMFPGYGKSILVKNDYVASEDISAYFENATASTSLFRIGC